MKAENENDHDTRADEDQNQASLFRAVAGLMSYL